MKDVDLLLEEAFAELTQLGSFRRRLSRLHAGLDPRLTHPRVRSSDMDAEAFRDRGECDTLSAVLRHAEHIVAELLGKRLEYHDIFPGQPTQLATFDVTYSCSTPLGFALR